LKNLIGKLKSVFALRRAERNHSGGERDFFLA